MNILTSSNKHTIKVIINRGDPFPAVYAVSNPNDDTIIYVGQTSNIVDRMRQHLVGSSVFRDKIKIQKDELKWYKIRYRRMADERQRKFFESFVMSVLKPKYNF